MMLTLHKAIYVNVAATFNSVKLTRLNAGATQRLKPVLPGGNTNLSQHAAPCAEEAGVGPVLASGPATRGRRAGEYLTHLGKVVARLRCHFPSRIPGLRR